MVSSPPCLLVLHGNRQSGELLLGRINRCLKKLPLAVVAPDAPHPHPEDANLCTWWKDYEYDGLDESLQVIEKETKDKNIVGILGFSQGARLTHLLALLHSQQGWLPQLRFAIICAGYEAPLPSKLTSNDVSLALCSLHIYGTGDALVTPDESKALMKYYRNPQTLVHEGSHFVPVQAHRVPIYKKFIEEALDSPKETELSNEDREECLSMQQEEVEALQAIYPDEVDMREDDCHIRLDGEGPNWPPHPLHLCVSFPKDYPLHATPIYRLDHENNMMEFPWSAEVMEVVRETSQEYVGTSSVLMTVTAVLDLLNGDEMKRSAVPITKEIPIQTETSTDTEIRNEYGLVVSSSEEIRVGDLQGLEIASEILQLPTPTSGGSMSYTIGLVGKPSAGKSTFFNAATCFARQRCGQSGASMAPHPFTTIDPNVGYCLIPSPKGSCPEEDEAEPQSLACTHGRDAQGRRFIPVLLKDVAGLVPGAYQGKGRGNQFLNDLCAAQVLIHVMDASGTSDAQGNKTSTDGNKSELTNPLDDMAWIRNELVEWMTSNLLSKWDTISRKGRSKLGGMFSGYGQKEAVTAQVLDKVEQFMESSLGRPKALDDMGSWNQADLRRLVSAFLGVRFPLALALNKSDLPSSAQNIKAIRACLPKEGSLVCTPMAARKEMEFVKQHTLDTSYSLTEAISSPPTSVWSCLTSAIQLKEPLLVFPVRDIATCEPLPGMTRHATEDPSLPNSGMIETICAATGTAPALWNGAKYVSNNSKQTLRDCIMMQQGSTVEDVFLVLKNLGALSGEFVRAEACGKVGQAAKPIPKQCIVTRAICILQIMVTKRSSWQN